MHFDEVHLNILTSIYLGAAVGFGWEIGQEIAYAIISLIRRVKK